MHPPPCSAVPVLPETADRSPEQNQAGEQKAAAGDEVDLAPLSDGGPGFVDVLATALPEADRRSVTVEDALARKLLAGEIHDGQTVAIELNEAGDGVVVV